MLKCMIWKSLTYGWYLKLCSRAQVEEENEDKSVSRVSCVH